MGMIGTPANKESSDYKNNFTFHQKLWQEIDDLEKKALLGGGSKALESLRTQGKLTVHERLTLLLDDYTSFLELSSLAAHEVYEEDGKYLSVPKASLLCGIGQVHGRYCMIIANDPTVKGGSYFPLTVKKHLRAQRIAWENKLPCLYLVDSGGAYLPKQDEVFPDREHFGRIFFHQAKMSAEGIAQIAAVLGSCTAGGAYVPAMSDETIIVKNQGTIFLAGPPLVEAATGEVVDAESLGGGLVHSQLSGVVDHLVESDQMAIEKVREIVSRLPQNSFPPSLSYKAPQFSSEELWGLLPQDTRKTTDVLQILSRLIDDSDFLEFKKNFGTTLICGFASIMGSPVGILANQGVLFSESAQKGAHFIQLCEKRRIPLLFVQNISGFMVGKKYENEGIAKHGAKLVTAVACASVPKLTLVIGGSFGAGNYGMCGRAYDPRFLWMWPNAKISVMGGMQAAEVLLTVKKKTQKLTAAQEDSIKAPILEKYEKEGKALYSSARLWDDGIISPLKTREVLGMALKVVTQHISAQADPAGFGIFRM